jgi:predicted ATPase
LVQDAAYQSLLRSKRQHLHARVAITLEEQFPEVAESEPEVVAEALSR